MVALAGSARADALGVKDVILKDGTRVTGRIEEIVPGDRCVVRGKDGIRRFVQWSAIKRIAEPGTPDEKPEPPPPPPLEPDPEPKKAEAETETETTPKGDVLVEIRSSDPVRLERSLPNGGWELACNSPCNVALPVDASYRIMSGATFVRGLRLDANGRDKVSIEVSVGSSAARALGITGLVVGSIVGYAGLIAISDAKDRGEETGGLAAITLLGVVVAGLGAIGVASSGSSITQSSGTSARDAVSFAAPPKKESLPQPRMTGGTLFTLKF